ncbi:mucin-22-like [Dermacentor albipictus]|uniref:mucin-22-like n=1 Tax=Dermacentor albipictus TaxID=60249 RepID=UPI0031FC20E7
MITSRRRAICLIGIHIVPNIVGVIRFSYGFHRTSSAHFGLLLDALLGVESVVNIVSDVIVIVFLWKAEKAGEKTTSPQELLTPFEKWLKEKMPRVLGAFVAWNTAAMLLCCGANLIGLRCPPKWYTNQDASSLTIRKNLTIVVSWAPVIIFAAFVKLCYTYLLYDFYKTYKLTRGRAFDRDAPVDVLAKVRQRGRLWPFSGWLTGGRTPGEKTPAGGVPGGRTPGTRTPGGRTPGSRTPRGPTPGGQTLPPVEQATSTGGETSGTRTTSERTPGGRTPGRRTPGGRTPGGRTPGGRTVTRTLEAPTLGVRTPKLGSPPGYAEASAGTGSTTPASQRPRVRATRQSEGDEGGASATAGTSTTTLSQTKNKRQKRGTATPTVPARLSTAERKPRQSDRAAAEQAANESSAATSGMSSARAAKPIAGAGGLAADLSAKGSRQAPPGDLVKTEVSVATTASRVSSANPTTRRNGGGASGQPDDIVSGASSAGFSLLPRRDDSTEGVRTATSAVMMPQTTDRHVLGGRTPRQLEVNATAAQAEGTASAKRRLVPVHKTDGKECLRAATDIPKTARSSSRMSSRLQP